jgi:hypothetical protein
VAQVSKPAVSLTSKSAERRSSYHLPVWKPAIQQTWKAALRNQGLWFEEKHGIPGRIIVKKSLVKFFTMGQFLSRSGQ